MAIVALIPARGGSKSIKGKNVVLCAGRPLISYTCEAALESQYIDRVIVSTDSDEIANVAIQNNVEVPFKRPSNLAADDTPMIDVIQHAINYLQTSEQEIEALVLLQPTSPLRNSRHIDQALKMYFEYLPETVVSVMEVPHQYIPTSLFQMNTSNKIIYGEKSSRKVITRRQDKPKFYARNGPAIIIVNTDIMKRDEIYGNNTIGYVMDKEFSIDVDTKYDLVLAEFILTSKQ